MVLIYNSRPPEVGIEFVDIFCMYSFSGNKQFWKGRSISKSELFEGCRKVMDEVVACLLTWSLKPYFATKKSQMIIKNMIMSYFLNLNSFMYLQNRY